MQQITTVTKSEPVKVLMTKEQKDLLKKLYQIRCYSGFEEPLRNLITEILDSLNIPYINYNGNILGFNHKGAPLFSAHMDMVNTEYYQLKPGETSVTEGTFTIDDKGCMRLYRDKEKTKQTSLGADDKNGIWVILELLKAGHQINFAFCHSEEVGGTGSKQVIDNKDLAKFISTCKYGIVIDRRNSGDIIGYNNKYCMVLDDKISSFAKEKGLNYKPERGSISDADRFSEFIECVNLSCGYYEPHTSREYTNLNELLNTYKLCEAMVTEFNYTSASTKRVREFKGLSTYNYDYGYNDTKDEDVSEIKKKLGKTHTTEKKKKKTSLTDATVRGSIRTKKTSITDGNLENEQFKNLLIDDYLDEVITDGVAYCEELDTTLVPLYPLNEVNKKHSAIATITCSDCGKEVALTQEVIDAIWMGYYNTDKTKLTGWCMNCFNTGDINDWVKKIMQ